MFLKLAVLHYDKWQLEGAFVVFFLISIVFTDDCELSIFCIRFGAIVLCLRVVCRLSVLLWISRPVVKAWRVNYLLV